MFPVWLRPYPNPHLWNTFRPPRSQLNPQIKIQLPPADIAPGLQLRPLRCVERVLLAREKGEDKKVVVIRGGLEKHRTQLWGCAVRYLPDVLGNVS